GDLVRRRQGEVERGAGPRGGLHPDSAALKSDQLLAQCKTQPVARRFLAVEAPKCPEYALLEGRLDPGTIVLHGEYPIRIDPSGGKVNSWRELVAVLDGISNEMMQDLSEQLEVTRYGR